MAKWKKQADAFKVKAGALKSKGDGDAKGLDKTRAATQTQTEPGADNKCLAKSGTNSLNYDDLHKTSSAELSKKQYEKALKKLYLAGC